MPKERKLTPAQQELAMSVYDMACGFVRKVPFFLIKRIGSNGVIQECMHAACKAACDWRPLEFPETTFAGFAHRGMKKHLLGLICRQDRRERVWEQMRLVESDYDHAPPVPKSYFLFARDESAAIDPFRWWFTPDAWELRRSLPLRYRVFLYLVIVEGWWQTQAGSAMGICKSRSYQFMEKIRHKIVEAQCRRAVAARRSA